MYPSESEKNRRRNHRWLFPVIGVSAALVAATCFTYCAYEYVPYHAVRLAEAGAMLPLLTRLAIVTANWYIRLLPFAVMISLFVVGPLAAVLVGVALPRGAPRYLWPAFGIVFLCLAAVAAVLSGIMLYGIHVGYAGLTG